MIPDITLNDGATIPAIVFGTYGLNGAQGVVGVKEAIDNGYLGLDSAFNYENEGAVGRAVRESPIPRESLRITSKLPGRHHKFSEAIATIEESLYRAQLDYYDLYLIHWPNPRVDLYVEAWQALIEARGRGLIRSIGVCNFLPVHLQRLIDETGVTPAINQIELHPFFQQAEQRAWDAAHGIRTQGWSPLARGSEVLTHPVLQAIGAAHAKSVAQIILRWEYQLGVIPLPKASSSVRQIENRSIFDFELSPAEMAQIAKLDRPGGRIQNQDPAVYEEF